MKKLRIGMLSRFPPAKDGIAIYTESLISNLDAEIIKIGGSKYPLDLKSFSLRKKVSEVIRKEKIDVLHIQYIAAYYSKAVNLNLLSLLKLPIPKVVTLHEVHMHPSTFRDWVLSMLERIIAGKVPVITHSAMQKAFLKEKVRKESVHMVYQGLYNHKTSYHKGKNLLFFGIISKNKGVPLLLQAMKGLPDFTLKVAGMPLDDGVKEELWRIKPKNVDFEFGWIAEKRKADLYAKSNIVVLPYLWGPYQSAVMHDAISFSKPVVVTDIGSLPEIVKEFSLGEVVEPRPSEIEEGIRKIEKDYDSYFKGIQEYKKIADWRKIAEKHMKIYKNVVEKG